MELWEDNVEWSVLKWRDIASLGVQPHHLLSDEILFKLLSNNKAAALEVGVCISVCFFLGEKGEHWPT